MQHALDYEQDNIKLAAVVVTMAELRELSPRVPSMLLDLAMPLTSGSFKAIEDTKAVQIDAGDPAKTMQIGASFDSK
jgi:hypothetical protein